MNDDVRARIASQLQVSLHGLHAHEVLERRQQSGWNEIPPKRTSMLELVAGQFHDTMIYILVGAAAVSVAVPFFRHGTIDRADLTNAIVILIIVLLNALLGFAQEWRAENAIAALQKLSAPRVKVRRSGSVTILPSRELVAGDILLLEAGDRISADARLLVSSSLEVDESSLTGESLPVSKCVEEHLSSGHAPCGILFSSTLITRGFAEAVVISIGLATEIGKITSMVLCLKSPPTPLELELKRTGNRIGVFVLALCALIFAAGVLSGMAATDIFLTAVSLAVAAVPEGLPAVVTVCLAIGVQRMIRKNALIRRLDAVETLGSVTVICADKTGTITQNRMVVKHVWIAPDGNRKTAIEIAASCNHAELPDIGDPTEVALLKRAKEDGIQRLPILEEEVPFTSEAKYMVTIHEKGGERLRYLKGAPEVIARFLPDHERREVLAESEKFSQQGLRVLAVASGVADHIVCAGLLAMIDPPRVGVTDAIACARTAGIRTVMITGDHPATALAVALQVGMKTDRVILGDELENMDLEEIQHALRTTSVFARVQPKHKVQILEAFHALGDVVAMSGDGVNDAPALKRAHVGVAMGLNGTDIARESAAMVLTDDNFATIVAAIAEGRRIYDNIQKFILFLMRSNLGEVLIIAIAMLLRMPLPLLPLHILWINLVTDSFPALALAAERGEDDIMRRTPRSRHNDIFTGEWLLLIVAGLLNAALALGAFAYVRSIVPGDLVLARTVALTTTILFQLALAISTRTKGIAFLASPFGNPWMIGAIGLSFGLHLVLLLSPLSLVFGVTAIPMLLWEEIAVGVLVTFAIFEGAKWGKRFFPS